MDPITIASLIASAIGGIGGLAGSAGQNKSYSKYIDSISRRNDAWYNKEANTNYLDTEEAKGYLRNILDQNKEMVKDQESKGAITGQSAEKSVATKEATGKNYNRAVTDLAGYGTRRKDFLNRDYQNRLSMIDQLKLGQILQKQGNWDQFGQNALGMGSNALLGSILGDGGGPLGKKNTGNAGQDAISILLDTMRKGTTEVGLNQTFKNKGKAQPFNYGNN